MPFKDSRLRWLAVLSTVLSLAVCYGTLGIIALLGVQADTGRSHDEVEADFVVRRDALLDGTKA